MINFILASTFSSTLIFSGQAIDIASTEIALKNCPQCYESNPLTSNRAILYPAKFGFALLGVAISRQLEKDGHKTSAKIFAVSMFIVPSILAYHNLKVIK